MQIKLYNIKIILDDHLNTIIRVIMDNRDYTTDISPSSVSPTPPLSSGEKKKTEDKKSELPKKLLEESETKAQTELIERQITPTAEEMLGVAKQELKGAIISEEQGKEEVETTQISHNLAANFLGDAFITNATFKGHKLEGSTNFQTFSLIREILLGEQKKNQDLGQKDPFINSMIQSLDEMLDFDKHLTTFESFQKWISEKISVMNAGESFAFPGGWLSLPAGHLIVNELIKQENGNFSLKIYNTGDGTQYHSSVIINNQSKFDSSFVMKDISLETLKSQEVWKGYFLLRTHLPLSGEQSYSSRDYYEGFLRSIKPGFIGFPNQKPTGKNLMRGARAGICSVDAFRAFMRGHGSTKAYKSTDFAIKQAVLRKYFAYFENSRILNPLKSTSIEDIQNNLGALRLMQDYAERLAHDIGVGIDHNWISDDEVKQANAFISEVCKKIKDAIKENERLFIDSSPKIQLTPDKSIIELEAAPLLAEMGLPKELTLSANTVKPLIDNTDWHTGKTKEILRSWTDAILSIYSKGNQYKDKDPAGFYRACDAEVNRFTSEIFSKLPSINDPYWEQIPDQDKEECMSLICNLSEHFVRTRFAIQNATICHPDQICDMQKVLGVMKKLINLLPNDSSGLKGAFLETPFLSLDSDMNVINARIIAYSPHLEQALVESAQMLINKGEIKSQNYDYLMFGSGALIAPKYQYRDAPPLYKISHQNFTEQYEVFKNKYTNCDEASLVYKYLEEHPEVKILIQEKLQKEKPDIVILPAHILAAALTDLEGKYLSKAFCAFRKQFYLTLWFVQNRPMVLSEGHFRINKWFEPLIQLTIDTSSKAEIHIKQSFRMHFAWDDNNSIYTAYRQPSEKNLVVSKLYNTITDRKGLPHNKKYSANEIMLDKTRDEEPVQFSSLAESEEYRELRSIVEGRSHNQVVKIVAFFNRNLNKLIDSDYQLLFQYIIFECGLLHKQLEEHPDFALTLADFVKRGYEYSIGAKNNIPAALFFLRMGSYFDRFCKEIFSEKLKPSQPYQFFSVPHTLQSLNKSINELPLQEQIRDKCLIARDFLAYHYREHLPDTIEGKTELLKCAFLLSEYPFWKNDPQYDPELDEQGKNALRELMHQLKDEDPKQLSEMLSLAIDQPTKEWRLDGFPTLISNDGQYRIDLLQGKLDIAGYTGFNIPVRVSQNDLFQSLFPNTNALKNIKAMGPYACSFIDDKGRENQVSIIPDNKEQNNFKKNINGVWCDFRSSISGEKLKDSSILANCTYWQTRSEPKQIYFLDKKTEKLVYVYDFSNKQLKCVDEGVRHNLLLVDMTQDKESYKFFTNCDSKAQIWKDNNDKIQFVELPTYGILLSVDNSKDPPRINAPDNLPGFFLSKQQVLPILDKISGYLVFENEEGERQVLIANKNIARSSEVKRYSGSLEFETKGKGVEPNFYQINAQGKLVSGIIKNNLYLAWIYIAKGDFNNAYKILHKMVSKPTAYTRDEIDLLIKINKSSVNYGNKRDPRAIALRLKAFCLILDHQKKPGAIDLEEKELKESIDDTGLRADMVEYLNQLFHVPSTYALKPEEEISLLTHIQRSRVLVSYNPEQDLICDSRLIALNETSTSRTLQNEDANYLNLRQNLSSIKPDQIHINITIDKDILDKFTNCIHLPKNFLAENFLSLYRIAKDKNKLECDRLMRLMAWVNSPPDAVEFAEIIEGVLRKPDKFPTLESIQEKFKNNKIESELSNLYSIARPRNPWYKSNITAIHVQPIHRKKHLPFKEISSRSTPLESEQKVESEQKELSSFKIPPKTSLFSQAELSEKNQTQQQDSSISLMAKLDQFKSQEKDRKENRIGLRGINELTADLEASSKTKSKEWLLQKDAIPEFKKNHNKQREKAQNILIQMKEELRKLANKSPADPKLALRKHINVHGRKVDEITVKELQLLFVRNNVNAYQERNPSLSFEEIQELNAKVENYLIFAIQSQQLDRIGQAITAYERSTEEPVQNELAQDIYRELSATRAYETRKHPEFLVFEYRKNLLMHEEQVKGIERLLDKKQESIQQIIMGGGKSDILLPLLALKKADGDALSIIMVPSELIDTVSDSMHVGSGKIFSQVSNRINWKDTSLEGLKKIYERLKLIQENREFLLVTSREMHDFALAVREARLDYTTGRSTDKPRLEEFYKIKELLHEKGDVLIDEVDTILRSDLEVHKALGEEEIINPLYSGITTKIYETLMTDQRITDKVYFEFSSEKYPKGKNAKPFTAEEFPALKNIIGVEAIAHLRKQKIPLSNEETYAKEINDYETEINKYVFAEAGEKVFLPATISNDLIQALAFIRSQIHLFLPSTLNKLHNANYGVFPSKDFSTLIAGPYENTQPHFGSQFGHYTEQMNYTIQSYLKTGIPKEQIQKVLKRLQNDARAEWASNPLLQLSDLGGYKEFLDLFGDNEAARKMASTFDFLTYDENEAERQLIWITKTLSAEPKSIHLFLNKYILPKITTYNMRMTSNAQMLPDMFHRVQGVTGTVEKDKDTFHSRFTTFAAEGISGKTISLLWKNSKDSVHTLKTEKPLEILDEMVNAENANLHAIMDAGALFKDVSHDILARKILNIREDLDAVVFYQGNKAMILKRKKDDPKNYTVHDYTTFNDVHTAKRFTIYDQPHCTGANLRQAPTAHAWITMNKNQNFRDMSQAAWRMRGLDKGQKVGIFLQKGLDETIKSSLGKSEDAKLDILDPMLYAIKVQGHQQAEINLKSIRQKLGNIVFQTVDAFLDSIDLNDLPLPMYRQLNELTLTILKDTPYEQFGIVETKDEAQKVLDQFRDNAIKGIEAWHTRYRESPHYMKYSFNSRYRSVILDIEKLNSAMQDVIEAAINPLQPMVEEQISSRENHLAGVEVSVEVRQNINQEQEQEEEQEQITSEPNKQLDAEPQLPWPELENMRRKDYFTSQVNAEGLAKAYPFSYSQLVSLSESKTFKPLLSAKDALATAPKGLLDNNLLFSTNLLFTEKYGTIFGPRQKPFGPCLIIQSKVPGEPLKLLLLTDEDADLFKEALDKAKGGLDQRVCLYYPNVGIYQQRIEQVDPQVLNTKEFKKLLVQYKFLNGETVAYTKEELDILRDWLTKQGNVIEIKEYFRRTLIKSSVNAENFLNPNTPITLLFDELINEQSKQRNIQIKSKLNELLNQNAKLAEQWNDFSKVIQNHILRSFRDGLDSRQDFAQYFQESVEWVNRLRQLFPSDQRESDFDRITALYFLAGSPFDYQTKQNNILAFLDLTKRFPNKPPLINLNDWTSSSITATEFQKLGSFFSIVRSKYIQAGSEQDKKSLSEYEALLKEISSMNNLSSRKANAFRGLIHLSPENTSVFLQILRNSPSALAPLLKFRKITEAQSFNYFIQRIDFADFQTMESEKFLENNLNLTIQLVKVAMRLDNPYLLNLFKFGCRNTMYCIINAPGFVDNYSRLLKNSELWRDKEFIISNNEELGSINKEKQEKIINLCAMASHYPKAAYHLLSNSNRFINYSDRLYYYYLHEINQANRFKGRYQITERLLQKIEQVESDEELKLLLNFIFLPTHEGIKSRLLEVIEYKKVDIKTISIVMEFIGKQNSEQDSLLITEKLVELLEAGNVSFIRKILKPLNHDQTGLLKTMCSNEENFLILLDLFEDARINFEPVFGFLFKWSSMASPVLPESMEVFWPLFNKMWKKLKDCPANKIEECRKEITEVINRISKLRFDQPDLAVQLPNLQKMLK